VALVSYSPKLAQLLGIPVVSSNFYPNILGAVFLGITLALLLEAFRKPNHGRAGLGLTGALCINLCGGMALILWLAFGRLQLPVQGDIALWGLSVVLIVISTLELIQKLRI
jgi:hypothetical protein